MRSQTTDSALIKPSWWFGAAAGANFDFYRGSTQKLNDQLTPPTAFHNGTGIGLLLGPVAEYHRPDSRWGLLFMALYDVRNGKFNQVKSPCNCPTDLSIKLSYISIEPNLRFAPFKSSLYFYAGPRFALLMKHSFEYRMTTNPDVVDVPNAAVTDSHESGNLSDMRKMLLSMQLGLGYDLPLSSKDNKTQFVLSPFAVYQPYFGQSPRTIETWNITTFRAGIIFKFGRIPAPSTIAQKTMLEKSTLVSTKLVAFSVYAPKNIPVDRMVRETFPIRNYVFFDLASAKIPDRYVQLRKDQVKEFKETQLDAPKTKSFSGRSNRQMVAYYNILNILGDRMQKMPSTSIKLVGSSDKGEELALAMANAIKTYLVDVFGIDEKRIALEGRTKPKKFAIRLDGSPDLDLIVEEDQRVSIESISPSLLMEFQAGQDVPLKPVEMLALQEAPIDSYVTFNVEGATEKLKSWSLVVTDDKKRVQNFGPYTQSRLSLPGKTFLGTRPEGDFKIKMIGVGKDGKMDIQETTVHMVLWTPSKQEEGIRYSIIFDFDDSKASAAYEKYLSEVVVPKIPVGATVIIHGYTDVIGDATHNQSLSLERTAEVKNILEKTLANANRSDVQFDERAYGEDEFMSPFENQLPEQRFYNRTVIIDIVLEK
jgi:outer membrane protein OmpA-like peptidoglycan-associated protein